MYKPSPLLLRITAVLLATMHAILMVSHAANETEKVISSGVGLTFFMWMAGVGSRIWRCAPAHGLAAAVLAYEVFVGCSRCSLPAGETRLFFGMPTALIGLVAHSVALVLHLALPRHIGPLLLSAGLVGASAGLAIRLASGGWWCPVCMAGHAAMLGLAMSALLDRWFRRAVTPPPASWGRVGLLGGLAVAAALLTALWPAPTPQRKPVRDLLPGLEEGVGALATPRRALRASWLPLPAWTGAEADAAHASTASLDRDARWGPATAPLLLQMTVDPGCHRCVASWHAVSRAASAAVARGEAAVVVALAYEGDAEQTLATLAYAAALRDPWSMPVILDELLQEGALGGSPAEVVRRLPPSLRARELISIVRHREADITALLEQAEQRIQDWGSPVLKAGRGGTVSLETGYDIEAAEVVKALALP